MHSFTKSILVALASSSAAAFVVLACGSSNDSTFTDPNGSSSGQFDTDGSFNQGKPDAGDLYANDPPPKWCGPTDQPAPPQPGGTIECPDDKNKPGCGCTTAGETAPCWTGLRANRNLGDCKDGVATCVQLNETRKGWSECVGEVLPVQGAKGAAACRCFSMGEWKLANLAPCFLEQCTTLEDDPDRPGKQRCVPATVTYRSATSSTLEGNTIKCPAVANPQPVPAGTWTSDTIKADCAGEFELCYELKAGDAKNPQPGDCSLAKVCLPKTLYKEAGVEQAFPDLGTWAIGGAVGSAADTCIQKWNANGGYGEMSVKGLSVRCDAIDDGAGNSLVFNRIQYCPAKCRGGANPTDPQCVACANGGAGTF